MPPGLNKERWILEIPGAEYWSTDNPYLYSAETTVQTGGVTSDHWESRFGMREFTIRNDRFYLNGEPLYLKACFFEGLYPVKLAYPDSREMAIREIQLAKDAGFNMIRPWRKPPPPMWLDLCDEMGMLTVGSLVVECMERPLSTPYLPYRVENELRQSVLRDRNWPAHPCSPLCRSVDGPVHPERDGRLPPPNRWRAADEPAGPSGEL